MQPIGADRRSVRRLLPIVAAAAVLTGCGYVSEPLPPLMNIPGRAENLAVLQAGANLIVHFTLPTLTTEGQLLKQAVRLDLRIGPKPAGQVSMDAWAAGATPVGGGTTSNGIAEYRIPVSPWIGKEVSLAVRVAGSNRRDAGWTNPVSIAVVAPPEQPQDVRAEAVPEGVRLTWRASDQEFLVLRRGAEEKDYKTMGRTDKREYIDSGAQFGNPYSYLVIGVMKAGTGEAHSDASQTVAITPVDTFPPGVPKGLTAVASTTSIELVWERGTEPSLTGYRIYRAAGNGALERIAETADATYSDRKIEPGKTYRYTVTAVKKNGRESAQAPPVEAATP